MSRFPTLAVLGERVLVKTEPQGEYTTASGLIVQEDYAPEVLGTVMFCAEGLDVKPDDVVIFPPSAGREMDYEGERYLVLDADDILAVVE